MPDNVQLPLGFIIGDHLIIVRAKIQGDKFSEQAVYGRHRELCS
jgi:hypothetical protein